MQIAECTHQQLRFRYLDSSVYDFHLIVFPVHRQTERRIQTTIRFLHKRLSQRAQCFRSSADQRPPTKKRPTPSILYTVSCDLCGDALGRSYESHIDRINNDVLLILLVSVPGRSDSTALPAAGTKTAQKHGRLNESFLLCLSVADLS